jgi:ParB/RepB/Spo0J family partition protein
MEVFDAPLDKIEEDNIAGEERYGDEAEQDRLGESLKQNQDYPILLNRHLTLAGWFKLVDGHRRLRAARRAGMKSLKAILVATGLTEAQIRLIQMRTDFHKKHLTPFERSVALQSLEAANPGTVKQLAAAVGLEESLAWRYLQIKKLGPESLEAYRTGVLGLADMVEVAKRTHDKQSTAVQIKRGGGSRAEMARDRQNEAAGPAESEEQSATGKLDTVKIAFPDELTVTLKGKGLTQTKVVEILVAAQKEAEKAKDQGLSAKSFQNVMRDRAKNPVGPPRAKKRKEASHA